MGLGISKNKTIVPNSISANESLKYYQLHITGILVGNFHLVLKIGREGLLFLAFWFLEQLYFVSAFYIP